MKRILSIAALAIVATQAFAQSQTSSTSLSDWRKSMKSTGLSLILDDYLESNVKDQGNYVGFKNYFDVIVNYKATQNDSFMLLSEVATVTDGTDKAANSDSEVTNSLDIMEARYKRSNILTQSEHGTDLYATALLGYFPNDKVRANSDDSNWGYVQARVGTSNSFGNNFTVTNQLRYYQFMANDYKSWSTGELNPRTKNYIRYHLRPALAVNDKLTTYVDLNYRHIFMERDTDVEYFKPEIGGTYTLSKDVSAGLYANTKLMKSRDGVTVADNAFSDVTYGLNLTLTAF